MKINFTSFKYFIFEFEIILEKKEKYTIRSFL